VTAPDAQPPAEPHDPTHLMYDADTGICCDCPRMVDRLAAPVAAALDPALAAFNSAIEFGTPDEIEHGITVALRAAFLAVPPASAALDGTPTPTDAEAELVEQALRCVDTDSAGHWPTAAGWLAYEVRRLRALLASTPTRTEET